MLDHDLVAVAHPDVVGGPGIGRAGGVHGLGERGDHAREIRQRLRDPVAAGVLHVVIGAQAGVRYHSRVSLRHVGCHVPGAGAVRGQGLPRTGDRVPDVVSDRLLVGSPFDLRVVVGTAPPLLRAGPADGRGERPRPRGRHERNGRRRDRRRRNGRRRNGHSAAASSSKHGHKRGCRDLKGAHDTSSYHHPICSDPMPQRYT